MYILNENIVNVKENLSIEIKNKTNYSSRWYNGNNNFGEVRLIRDLKTDTFDLEISRPPLYDLKQRPLVFHPFVNINNSFQFSNSDFKDKYKARDDDSLYYRVPSGLLENKKFSSIKELYVGLVHKSDISKDPYVHMMKFNFKNNFKRVHLSKNKASRIKIVKEVKITFNKNWDSNVEFDLFEFYYVPIAKNRKKPIQDVADIYVFSNYSKKEDDTLLDEGLIKTSSIKAGLKTRFVAKKSEEVLEIIGENISRWPKKIGKNTIIDHTYYDYKKKKTILGFGLNSSPGEIIPYSFQGSYVWLDTLDLFYAFKKFTFVLTKSFDQPYLNVLNGQVQLEIQNIDQKKLNQKNFFTTYLLKKEKIKLIKNNEKISLASLERMSIEI